MRMEERRDRGLCVDCGAPACRTIQSPAVARKRAKMQGVHENRWLFFARCIPCEDKHKEAIKSARERRQARRARARECKVMKERAGLCPRCGKNPPDDGRKQCRPCLDAMRVNRIERGARRREAGVCVTCGGPREIPTFLSCYRCRKRSRESKRRMKNEGL